MEKFCTIFSDIDGTLFKYRKFETYKLTIPEIIYSSVNSIKKAYDTGHCIVLTTARPEYLRQHTINELMNANIKYHQLIMGIGRGSRILINDNETEDNDRAFAFPLIRNKGFSEKDIFDFEKILE